MLDAPHVAQLTLRPTALIHLTIPKDEIQHAMGPALHELMAALKTQDVTPTGPWFTHHLALSPDVWDFEVSIPVDAPVRPSGRVQPGEWPDMTAARTLYRGPYEGLGEAWGEFLDWIGTQGHTPAPDLYECYVTGPESGADSAQYCTELTKPLTFVAAQQ